MFVNFPAEEHKYLTPIIPRLLPIGVYPATTLLHEMLRDRRWEEAHWRLNGFDWEDADAIMHGKACDESVAALFLHRVKSCIGFFVMPKVPCFPKVPEYCFARNGDGKLPFHVALDYCAPLEVLLELLGPGLHISSLYSEPHGLPIHYLCSCAGGSVSSEVREQLMSNVIRNNPLGCFHRSPSGDFPLQLLLSNNPTDGLVAQFTSVSDGSLPGISGSHIACLADCHGQVPLHVAFSLRVPREIIVAIAQMNPSMFKHQRDYDNKTPLDLSSYSQSDMAFITSAVTVPVDVDLPLSVFR